MIQQLQEYSYTLLILQFIAEYSKLHLKFNLLAQNFPGGDPLHGESPIK